MASKYKKSGKSRSRGAMLQMSASGSSSDELEEEPSLPTHTRLGRSSFSSKAEEEEEQSSNEEEEEEASSSEEEDYDGKISFPPTDRFRSIGEVRRELLLIFGKSNRKMIDTALADIGGWKRKTPAIEAFNLARKHLTNEKGLVPSYGRARAKEGSLHGPQWPYRASRAGPKNKKSAMSSFNAGQVTLARGMIVKDGKAVDFHDRNDTKMRLHAEDGIMEQVDQYFAANGDLDASEHSMNLTINKFFCSHPTTTKGQHEQNCLDNIIAFRKRHKFARMHVYFRDQYKGRAETFEHMEGNIKKLQDERILVTAATNDPAKKPPYVARGLDPVSESDEEEDDMLVSKSDSSSLGKRNKRSGGRKVKSRISPSILELKEEEEEEDGEDEMGGDDFARRFRQSPRRSPRPVPSKGAKPKLVRKRSYSPVRKGRMAVGSDMDEEEKGDDLINSEDERDGVRQTPPHAPSQVKSRRRTSPRRKAQPPSKHE